MTQKLLSLFRQGKDTLTIARELGIPESRVYNVINAEPKERKHAPTAKLRKLVPFAGYDGKEERI